MISFCKKILAGLLIVAACRVYSVEIPEEEGLSCSTLKNGIHLWMKPTVDGNFYCRIVACHPGQDAPEIFSLSDRTPEEFSEEDMPAFVPHVLQKIPNQSQCRIGVVVVGPFEKNEMEKYIAEAFESYGPRQPVPAAPPIVIAPSQKPDQVSTALTYSTPFPTLKTDADLKKMWILGLLRSIFEGQMKGALSNRKGARWLGDTNPYSLPFLYAVARGELDSDQEPMFLLTRFLTAMQELKSTGFTSDDLDQAKAKVNRKLQLFYQKDPTNKNLADYYAFHLALDDRCPSYPIFMPMSFQLIKEIEKSDFEGALKESFKNCRIEMEVPPSVSTSPEIIQEIVTPFKTETSDIEWKKEKVYLPLGAKAKDIFEKLPLTDKQAETIRDIIDTMYNKNVAQLGWIKSEMERKGKSVEDVHPLRFLGVVFSDPKLKRYMKSVHESYFKWNGFLNGSGSTRGFWPKMESENKKNNLLPYVEGFCLTVKANPEEVETILKNKGWDKLVIYLIYKD
jgi:hypothetical protein